jgi:hypothetical protein
MPFMSDDFDDLMRVQRTMAGKIRQENEVDQKVKMLSLIQGLNPDKRGRILTEQIVVEARHHDMSEDEVEHLLDSLESDGYLKKVDHGIMMLL